MVRKGTVSRGGKSFPFEAKLNREATISSTSLLITAGKFYAAPATPGLTDAFPSATDPLVKLAQQPAELLLDPIDAAERLRLLNLLWIHSYELEGRLHNQFRLGLELHTGLLGLLVVSDQLTHGSSLLPGANRLNSRDSRLLRHPD